MKVKKLYDDNKNLMKDIENDSHKEELKHWQGPFYIL